MAARICDACDISYSHLITECRVCHNTLRYSGHAEPSDWESESARLLADAAQRRRKIPLLQVGAIRDENGRHWLYAQDIVSGGWSHPVASFQLFELLDGSIVEVQGRDERGRRYWVELLGPSDGGW
jgi:hypothetical protein